MSRCGFSIVFTPIRWKRSMWSGSWTTETIAGTSNSCPSRQPMMLTASWSVVETSGVPMLPAPTMTMYIRWRRVARPQ